MAEVVRWAISLMYFVESAMRSSNYAELMAFYAGREQPRATKAIVRFLEQSERVQSLKWQCDDYLRAAHVAVVANQPLPARPNVIISDKLIIDPFGLVLDNSPICGANADQVCHDLLVKYGVNISRELCEWCLLNSSDC